MDPLKDLKDLLKNSEDNFSLDNLFNEYGIDLKELEENLIQKIKLEYVSESGLNLHYAYNTDSGFDLHSNVDVEIPSLGRALVPTGVKLNVPENYEVQVRSKSGLALNRGLMVLNSPGTVDQGYTGEIQVIVFNTNNHSVMIPKGMKVGQAVLCPVINGKYVRFEKVDTLGKKDRGDNGFGSTGI